MQLFLCAEALHSENLGDNASRIDITMKSKTIIIVIISGLVVSCSTKELPKNLNESIEYFEDHWSSGQLREFKEKDEEKAVSELHMSVGMWIRNNWIYGDRNPKLIRFFDSLNFRHADDISSTILTSLHRKLNNKDIDLQGQIDYYEAYWKPIIEEEENCRKELVEINKIFKVGDTLTLVFQVDASQSNRNAVRYPCSIEHWTFDEAKDLRVKGVVTRKFELGGPTNPFINLYITEMSNDTTKIYMRELSVGDTTEFALRSLTISRK